MAQLIALRDAVSALVHDGATMALEGFTHLIPFAAGHEVIRQRRRGLTLIRMTPDLIYDQMIGMGCAARLIFSWGGNPGVGSLHRFRDAIQNGWPVPLALEEHSHADMAARYQAGASGLPFAVMRGYVGSDLPKVNPKIKSITCPFTGEELAATPAINPDVTIIHAQKADRKGNVLICGIVGVQKEAALAAKRVIVTVEEAYLAGGFGSAVLELLEENGLQDKVRVVRMGIPDRLVTHGDPKLLLAKYGLRPKRWQIYAGESRVPSRPGIIGLAEKAAAQGITTLSKFGNLGTYIEAWAVRE